MLSNVLDRLNLILDLLVDPDTEERCRLSPEPCRMSAYPGAEIAWDVCETCGTRNGQLAAAVQGMQVSSPGPGCSRILWTAQIGVTRCAASVGNDGSPPPVDAVSADADQQAADADAIASLILCCMREDPALVDVADRVELVSWQPLGPSGGCVGGAWTVRGVLDVCC